MRRLSAAWLAALVLVTGCGGPPEAPVASAASAPAAAPEVRGVAAPVPADPQRGRRLVFLGDSLTAGLGLPVDQAYPSLIERKLAARGPGWTVVNAGVSGDTSAGALRRLEWVLDGGAAVVLVAVGGNDALRGLPPADLEKNLDAIVARAQQAGAVVVLAGMEAPPNNGPAYTTQFRDVYRRVASAHRLVLVPFLLDGVAGIETLNQADGIHPNQRGAELVADTVWKALEPVLREVEKATAE